MNRKIKSGKEIRYEIRSIFDNHKNAKELVENLNSYLNNLTGKELFKVDDIKKILYYETLFYDYHNKTKLEKNKELRKLSPKFYEDEYYAKHSKKVNKEISDKYLTDLKKASYLMNKLTFLKVPFDILLTCKDYEKYLSLNMETMEIFTIIGKEKPDYKKLFSFLHQNEDVSELLNMFLFEAKKKHLVDLIINKITPLNSIFVYFDKHKNIKENTTEFYLMLNKQFSRNIIQTTITRDLKKIKEGKFSVPENVL